MDEKQKARKTPDETLAPTSLEALYPEIYKLLYPLVVQAVDEALRSGQVLSGETLDEAADRIVMASGLWDEDGEEAAPVASYGYDRRNDRGDYGRGYDRRYDHYYGGYNRRGHHNRNTLRDIARILFLSDWYGRCRYGYC